MSTDALLSTQLMIFENGRSVGTQGGPSLSDLQILSSWFGYSVVSDAVFAGCDKPVIQLSWDDLPVKHQQRSSERTAVVLRRQRLYRLLNEASTSFATSFGTKLDMLLPLCILVFTTRYSHAFHLPSLRSNIRSY